MRHRAYIGDLAEKRVIGGESGLSEPRSRRTPPSSGQSASRDRGGVGGALIGGTRRVDEFRSTRRVIFKPSADPVATVRSRNVVRPANENQYFRRVARQRAQRPVAICRAITRALSHVAGSSLTRRRRHESRRLEPLPVPPSSPVSRAASLRSGFVTLGGHAHVAECAARRNGANIKQRQ